MKRSKHLWASESVPWACAFIKKGDLEKGNNYQLRRNSDNPKDTNCSRLTRATMNMNFSRLVAPFMDENIIRELTWYMIVYDLKFT